MLYAKRSDVIKEFGKLHKYSYQSSDLQLGLNAFRNLFGSKCLPDEDTKPAEPKEPTCTDDCPSQCPSQDFDNSFSKERRLNIAAMMMQGLLANPNNNANLSETVADALDCADTLIAEVEKGNSDGED